MLDVFQLTGDDLHANQFL